MAVNTTDKALDLATRLSTDAKTIAEAINVANLDILDKTASSIDFTTVDFSITSLKHLDGTSLNAAITILQAIDSYLSGLSSGTGSPTRRDVLLKVRR